MDDNNKLVPIDRTGITDNKLAAIILSDTDQDNKNRMIADYLIQNNEDSLAFMAEAFRTKGMLTKETRKFKSNMREDYEAFVGSFSLFLKDTAERLWDELDLEAKLEDCVAELKANKDKDISEYMKFETLDRNKHVRTFRLENAMMSLAVSMYSESTHLEKVVKDIVDRREREAGKGIYYDKLGRAHSLWDENIIDIIKAEKEDIAKQKDEQVGDNK
jgi:hypothetical protein